MILTQWYMLTCNRPFVNGFLPRSQRKVQQPAEAFKKGYYIDSNIQRMEEKGSFGTSGPPPENRKLPINMRFVPEHPDDSVR